MDGPGRHADLETRVKKLEPVQEAQADVQAGELTVFVRSDVALDDQDVFEAIRRCSFSPGRRLE